MLERLKGHDTSLKDAASNSSEQPEYAKNATRARLPEYLVLIGLCTHLGCLPKQRFPVEGEMGPAWPGGFFCPCHGSRFDLAGRVFDGSPASVNLRVPRYEFPNERTLRIGADEKGEA
jgi:ubiquinol-cytochrome c reductase iron-sulfur subunit